MKRLEKIYAFGLLIIFAGIVFHAPLSVWLGTLLPDYGLLIKSWKEIIMALLVPVAVVLVTQRNLWKEFGRDWLFRLLIAYAAVHALVALIMWHGVKITAAGLAIDLRYILFFALVYTLIRILPEYRKKIIAIAAAGAAVVVGFATLQLFLPADILSHIGYGDKTIQPYLTVDTNEDYVRVNSTLRGPNPLGAYAAVVLAVVAAFVLLQKRRLEDKRIAALVWLLGICGVIALWISYSRSAVVAGIIAVVGVVIVTKFRQIPTKIWGMSLVAASAVVLSLFVLQDTSFVSNVVLHDDPTVGASVSSNEGHVESLAAGFERMVVQPLGGGIGSTGSASLIGGNGNIIENQYLFIAHEAGWLGIGLYAAIFVIIMQRLWRRRSDWLALGVFAGGVGLALIGLLQPVWVDDTVSIVWWGIAAVAIIGKAGHGRQSTK